MTTSGVIRAYARALFDLASASDAVDDADRSMKAVTETVQGSAELREVLVDDSVPGSKKREIIADLFSGADSPEAIAIAALVIERGSVRQLAEVYAAFSEIAEAERGIVVAEVITAVPITDSTRELLKDKLSAALGKPVSLRENIDDSILGGIRINVAGRVLDGTLLSQLDEMRAVLSRAPQGGEA
ncbi:MAG: ATP synthase F1 subunit delta [Actinobacteria bacterium]|nr:ATP synthase F1 subunit delta [Actinomycetota bacterium]